MHQLLWTPLIPNFPDFCRIRFFFQHPLQAIQTVLAGYESPILTRSKMYGGHAESARASANLYYRRRSR